ncbi:unnamed protein product [Rotaria socialis]|uniref:Glycerophosphodiester phosphodiesterase n=1 Tax=Rotaria socialis TaxID=392032 RepID=A0A818Y881_9BILA|nr:unnamed protein product [Rotaria socialis]CAF4799787.1 unnamed protein product [Rotaria socialis]
MGMLYRFTSSRAYGTGSSSCIPKTFYSGIEAAVTGDENGENGLVYIWTSEKQTSMQDYINHGVQGIMTNRAAFLRGLVISMELTIAKLSDSISVSTKIVSSQNACDCS